MARSVGKLEPHDIKWQVTKSARDALRPFRGEFGASYSDEVRALKELLCGYFNDGDDCDSKSTNINPLGGVGNVGGKAFKVRWGTAGGGKSGGLRLTIVAYCKQRRVNVTFAAQRKAADDANFLAGSTDDEPGT
jgi:hypothetical protein